jgi:hypothetical protein
MTLKLQLVIKAETDLSFVFTTAIIFMSNIFPGLGERNFFIIKNIDSLRYDYLVVCSVVISNIKSQIFRGLPLSLRENRVFEVDNVEIEYTCDVIDLILHFHCFLTHMTHQIYGHRMNFHFWILMICCVYASNHLKAFQTRHYHFSLYWVNFKTNDFMWATLAYQF